MRVGAGGRWSVAARTGLPDRRRRRRRQGLRARRPQSARRLRHQRRVVRPADGRHPSRRRPVYPTHGAAAANLRGRILVFGGASSSVHDVVQQFFTNVYAFGGLISGGEYTGTFTTDIQRIDLRTGSARIIGHLPNPLAHAMAATVNGRIYLLGGSTRTAPARSSDGSTPATVRRASPAGYPTRSPTPLLPRSARQHAPGAAPHDPRDPAGGRAGDLLPGARLPRRRQDGRGLCRLPQPPQLPAVQRSVLPQLTGPGKPRSLRGRAAAGLRTRPSE
jgi:hypothetical protein